MFLHVVNHFAATGMNNPEPNLRLGKTMSLKQRVRPLLNHWPRQALDGLSQDNS
jgi:hypothetical protein